jgi:hypothetical protein
MVLKMSRPTKHPTTGIYQFRKRVPEHLIPLVGKREEKVSLGTRDPQEAKIVHARILAETEARWRQLSAGQISLSQKQAVAMSGEIYRAMIAENEDDPGTPHLREASLIADHLHLRPEKVKVFQLTKDDALFERVMETYKVRRNDRAINDYLNRHGYLLRNAVAHAVMQAKEHLLKLSNGDYRPDPDADRFPQLELAPKKAPKETGHEDSGKYGLLQVFEDFFAEKQQAAATYKKWKGIISKVALEVPDIRDLTADWVVDWKDSLLKKGLSAVSIRDGHLACLRATCTWAKGNRRIQVNPLDGITVAVPHKTTTRQKWFTVDEAMTILKGSLAMPPARCSSEMKAAYRWVPWLCATQRRYPSSRRALPHLDHARGWIDKEPESTLCRHPFAPCRTGILGFC